MRIHTFSAAAAVLFLGLAASGCGVSDAKSAFLRDEAQREKKDEGAASSSREKLQAGADDEQVYTPEASMRRDLARLREREEKQASLVSGMRNELSEGKHMVDSEEKRLAEIREQIADYEQALGTARNNGAMLSYGKRRNPDAMDNFNAYSESRRQDDRVFPQGYEHLQNRPQPVNLAYSQSQQPQDQIVPSVQARETQQRQPYNDKMFAGAPRGFARQEVANSRQNEPEQTGEIVVWNPNDPSQAIPPGVLVEAPRIEQHFEPEQSLAARSNRVPSGTPNAAALQERPYANFTTEVFSPDLHFGKGG